jgi:uncharacterized protein YceH (UPF0502 family)
MNFPLSEAEARVLGALIEKDMATPEYYPLSLNALVNACNQKSNREPVVHYDEDTVLEALESLRDKRLSIVQTGGDSRVPKYRHRIAETLNLGNRELAILSVLLLRGPQTIGELKQRTERLHAFDDLDAVESTLNRLAEWQPEPLAARLPKSPGTREARYAHLLSGPVETVAQPETAVPRSPDRLEKLEVEVAELREAVEELKQQLIQFRKQFE